MTSEVERPFQESAWKKITDKSTKKIINDQLDIKLEQFTEEELDTVLKKIKSRKAAGLNEIHPEVWKTRIFDDILLQLCNTVYKKKHNKEMVKRLHSCLL